MSFVLFHFGALSHKWTTKSRSLYLQRQIFVMFRFDRKIKGKLKKVIMLLLYIEKRQDMKKKIREKTIKNNSCSELGNQCVVVVAVRRRLQSFYFTLFVTQPSSYL